MSVAPAAPAAASPRWGLRVLCFVVLFALLQSAYSSGLAQPLQRWVIESATVGSAAALLGWWVPELAVRAEGPRLASPGGGLNVLNGCEGTDVALLMLAAMLVAPLPWRARLVGMALGLPLVFALNQARVLALFFTWREGREWFDLLHGTLAPLLLVMLVGLFYIAWLDRRPRAPA